MDSLELLDFSSFIIFPADPWSLLVSFRQIFKLPLVVQCCNVICEWPLTLRTLRLIWLLLQLKRTQTTDIYLGFWISFCRYLTRPTSATAGAWCTPGRSTPIAGSWYLPCCWYPRYSCPGQIASRDPNRGAASASIPTSAPGHCTH